MRHALLFLVLLLGTVSTAQAETFIGSGDVSNAANWSSGSVPGSADAVIFDGSAQGSVTIDIPLTVASISVTSAFGSSITQAAAVTTLGAWSLNGGTWNAGAQLITVGGAFSVAASGATFHAGTGAVVLNGSSTLSNPSNPFATLTIAAGQTTTLTSNTTVTQLCTISGTLVFINWYQLTLLGSGNLLNVPGSLNAISPNRGIIAFSATSTAPIFVPGGSYGWCQISLNSIGGVAADFEQTGSIVNIDSFLTTSDSAAGSVQWDTNSFDLISSSWLALGDFGSSLGGTQVHAGSSHIVVPALLWSTNAADELFLDASTVTAGEYAVWDQSAIVHPGTSTLQVASGIGPFWTTVPHAFYNLTVNGACPLCGPITVGHDLTVVSSGSLATENLAVSVGHDLNVQSGGSLVAGSSAITVGSDITIAGQDGAFQAGTSSVTLNGPGTLSDPDQTNTFYQLSLAASGATVLLGTDLTTTNRGTIMGGEVDFHNGVGAIWHIQGTGKVFSNQGSLWAGFGNGGYVRYENASSTIPMLVGGAYGWASLQLLSLGGASAQFQQVSDITAIDDVLTMVDTVGGSVHWVTNSHAIDSSSWMAIGNWGASLGGCRLDCGSSQISVPAIAWWSNPDDVMNLQNSTWNVGLWGAWNESAQIFPGTSTVITNNDIGAFWTNIPQSFYNLTINAPGATAFGDLTVAGTLTVAAGALNANGHAIIAAGDVLVAPAAALEGQGVELVGIGSQTLTSSDSSSIAVMQVDGGARTLSLPTGLACGTLSVAPGPTLRVGAGTTVSVGALDLAGTAALPIALQSLQPGTPWLITLAASGTQALSHVAAQDSHAVGGQIINATAFGTDLGDNVRWQFTSMPPPPTFTLASSSLTLLDTSPSQSLASFAVVTSPQQAAVSFQVTNDHAGLLSVQPAVDSAGTLTFTPNGTPGSALVSVTGFSAGNPTGSPVQTFSLILIPPVPTFTLATASLTVAAGAGPQTQPHFATITSPLNATVTFHLTSSLPGLFTAAPAIASNGTLTFTPAPGQSGSAQVSVVGSSAGNPQGSAAQSLTITVTTAQGPPTLQLIPTQTVAESGHPAPQTVSGFVTVLSPIPAQMHYVVTAANASNSTDPTLFTAGPAIDASGTLTYTLEPYQYGVITLSVQGFAAGNPVGSALYTSTLNVPYINQAPRFTMALHDTGSLSFGTAYSYPNWASLEVGPLSEHWQTASFTLTVSNPSLFFVPPTLDQNGQLTFVTSNATGSATVSVVLQDSGGTAQGGVDTAPAQSIAIEVSLLTGPPIAGQVHIDSYATVGLFEGVQISNASVQDMFGHSTSVPLTFCHLSLGFTGGIAFSAAGYAEVSLPTLSEFQSGARVAGITVEPFPAGTVSLNPRPNVYVGECLTCQTKGGAANSAGPAAPQTTTDSPLGLRIDNQRQDLLSEVTDYAAAGPGQGSCRSCDTAGSPMNGLPSVQLQRIHRYQDLDAHSSFGPGVFSSYDLSLYDMTSSHITLWDPQGAYKITFTPTGVIGTFTDTTYHAYQSLTLVDGYNTPTNDPNQAAQATLLTNAGGQDVFEIIPSALLPSGRMVSQADRNGAALTISYVYPATATLTQLAQDLTQLWKITTITDAYGRQLTVTYAATTLAGQWPIHSVVQPNGGTITYTYGDAVLGLSDVLWSNGDHSTFSASAATSTVQVDDAAASGEQRHQTLSFNFFHAPLAGAQPPWLVNRVAAVSNGAGELAYSTLPSGLNDTQFVVFQGGNSTVRLTTTASGYPLMSEQASAGSVAQPGQLSWYPLENYQCTAAHSLSSLQDAVGHTTTYVLNSEQAPTATTYPDGSSDSATYNAFKEPLHEIDRTGVTTDCTYDAQGNLLQKTMASGTAVVSTWSWQYNAFGQITQATDANGNVTVYVYNAHHFLIQRIDPADVLGGPQSVSSYTYDPAGRLATSTDASGRTTSYAYDVHDRLTTVTYADGSTEITTYGTGELSQLVVSTTDRNGHATTFGYDAAGRKISQTSAFGLPEAVTDTWTYLAGTDLVLSSTHNGNRTEYRYDYRNRLIATTTHPSTVVALTTTSTYDQADRLTASTDPYGRNTYSVYDVNDRVVRTVMETVAGALVANPSQALLAGLVRSSGANAAFLITDMTYDAEGRTLRVTDPRGIISTSSYDAQGRLSTQVEASGTQDAAQTTSSYDAQGNVTTQWLPRTFSTSDPIGYATTSTWSGRNLLLTRTEAAGRPEQAITSSTYTPTGKPATITDANGHLTTDLYEPCCDRLYQVIDALGGTTTYAYDAVGNTTGVTDANGNALVMTYDGRNRLLSSIDGAGDVTAYAYDDNLTDGQGIDAALAARLADLHLGTGAVGSAVAVTDPTQGVTTAISDGTGRTIRVFDPNANAVSTRYDLLVPGVLDAPLTQLNALGVLVGSAQSDALGDTMTQYADGAGRVLATTDALTQWTLLGVDADGNQLTVRDPNQVGMTCTFDQRNRRTTCIDTQGDSSSQGYDADGNVVTQVDGAGAVTTAAFDGRDRRVTLTDRIASQPPPPTPMTA